MLLLNTDKVKTNMNKTQSTTGISEDETVRHRQRHSSMTPAEIEAFISSHSWRFAKTMPQNPHWYVVKDKCRDAHEFERFVMHIRRHGYRTKFGRAWYMYFDWAVDGVVHNFWTMGAPLGITIIINRAVKK